MFIPKFCACYDPFIGLLIKNIEQATKDDVRFRCCTVPWPHGEFNWRGSNLLHIHKGYISFGYTNPEGCLAD